MNNWYDTVIKFNEAPSDEDLARYKKLFNKLDANGDGTVDIAELTSALWGSPNAEDRANEFLSKADINRNHVLDFNEFVRYMQNHEQNLRVVFANLDKDNNGKVEPSEVRSALFMLGVEISLSEAKRLTNKLDKNSDQSIDWAEWRDYFSLCPEETLEDLIDVWRTPPVSLSAYQPVNSFNPNYALVHRTHSMIDIGEQLTCPPEFRGGVSWRYLVAGGVAGLVSRSLTAPLDRLKIVCQVYGPNMEKSLWGGMKKLVEEGGWRSLWRGNGTSGMKIAPESAIRFYAYEQMKRWLKGDNVQSITMAERFAVGSASGAVAQTFIYPMEVIKTRLAISKRGEYRGIFDCAWKIIRKERITTLYRGYIPNLIGILPYAGIDLTIYETMKQLYMKKNVGKGSADPGIAIVFVCSTVSSTCGQLASYPFAMIRTRMQAQKEDSVRVGVGPMIRNIFREEGPRGFYHGLIPNMIKALPAASISYIIYERLKDSLGADKEY